MRQSLWDFLREGLRPSLLVDKLKGRLRMAEIKSIDIAAALYGCEPGELLSHRERENGDISVIAPTGQKFVYAKVLVDGQRKSMEEMAKPEPTPRRKAPAARKRALAKDNSANKKSVPS